MGEDTGKFCPYECRAKEEIKEMRAEQKKIMIDLQEKSFAPWMRALAVTLFMVLFASVAKLNIDLSKDYIPRSEARADMTEIKNELNRMNNKIDQLLQGRLNP